MRTPVRCSFLTLTLAGAAAAIGGIAHGAQLLGGEWELRYRMDGNEDRMLLGYAVAWAGDVDADGTDDWIAGAPLVSGGPSGPGHVVVISGRTGATILHLAYGNYSESFGGAVAGLGDVDGDGHSDLLVGARDIKVNGMARAGAAFIFSGRTGSILHHWTGGAVEARFGHSAACAGDVDADGVPDVVIGAYSEPILGGWNGGAAYVYSGATGALLHRFATAGNNQMTGFAVDTAGDIDHDGHADLLIAKPGWSIVLVYSGATGAEIRRFTGPSGGGEQMGMAVASLGDLDGDGTQELAMGSPWYPDLIRVYSGGTGLLLMHIGAQAFGFGIRIDGTGDLDGDGVLDFLVGSDDSGSGLQGAGAVFFYSGRTGSLLHRMDGEHGSDHLGFGAAGEGGADPGTSVALGAYGAGPSGLSGAGAVFIHHFHPYLSTVTHELSASAGGTVLLDLRFPLDLAGGRYALLPSRSGTGPTDLGPVVVPLTQDSWFNQALMGNFPPVLQGAYGPLDANARAQAALSVPPGRMPPSLVGTTLHLAAVAQSPSAGRSRASIAVRIEFIP